MTADLTLADIVVPEDSEAQNDLFMRAFNSGDGELFDRLYRDDAISNLSGAPLTGAARTAFIKEFLATGPALTSTVQHAYTTDQTTLIIVRYSIDMNGPDGEPIHIDGTCTDVLVRGADGRWIMAVDRPVPDTTHP
jgi:ketosteroid isomerase-like protein